MSGLESTESTPGVVRFLGEIVNPMLPLGVALRAWQSAAVLLFRSTIWLPFLMILTIQIVGFVLIAGFYHPVLFPVAAPLVALLGGPDALRYPILYLALPSMFARLNLGINILVASLGGGVATILFARAFGASNANGAWRRAIRRWPVLLAFAALSVALVVGVSMLTSLIPEAIVLQNRALRWGSRALGFLCFVVVQCYLAYTTAWVVLRDQSIWPSLRDSIRVASRTFLPTFLVIAVPSALLYPFSYAADRVEWIAAKFRPEVITVLLGSQLLLEILATFLVVGAVTRLFLWRMEVAR